MSYFKVMFNFILKSIKIQASKQCFEGFENVKIGVLNRVNFGSQFRAIFELPEGLVARLLKSRVWAKIWPRFGGQSRFWLLAFWEKIGKA